MAGPRTELQDTLEKILSSKNVSFAPSNNIDMEFPHIVYQLSGKRNDHADDIKYRKLNRYTITIIDEDPDSKIPEKIEELQYCSFSRFFISDNLNHWVYDLYY